MKYTKDSKLHLKTRESCRTSNYTIYNPPDLVKLLKFGFNLPNSSIDIGQNLKFSLIKLKYPKSICFKKINDVFHQNTPWHEKENIISFISCPFLWWIKLIFKSCCIDNIIFIFYQLRFFFCFSRSKMIWLFFSWLLSKK